MWRHHQDRVIAQTALFRPNGSEPDSLFGCFWDHWRRQHAGGKYMGEPTKSRWYRPRVSQTSQRVLLRVPSRSFHGSTSCFAEGAIAQTSRLFSVATAAVANMLMMSSCHAGERIFVPMNVWECIYKWVCCRNKLPCLLLLLTAAHVLVKLWTCLSCTLHDGC